MGNKHVEKSKKMFEAYLNDMSPDCDSEEWIIGGKNRYRQRDNYGTMLKRCDSVAFEVAYREWKERNG